MKITKLEQGPPPESDDDPDFTDQRIYLGWTPIDVPVLRLHPDAVYDDYGVLDADTIEGKDDNTTDRS